MVRSGYIDKLVRMRWTEAGELKLQIDYKYKFYVLNCIASDDEFVGIFPVDV